MEGPLQRCSFRLDPSQTWPPQESLVSDWLISKKIFCTETAWKNEPKLGRKHLWKVLYKDCPFRPDFVSKHRRHRQFLFLIGTFLKIFSSETAWSNELTLGRKHLWKVLYRDCSFRPDL